MRAISLPFFPTVKVQPVKEQRFQKSYLMQLFNQMSASYEGMNYLTSFGFSYLWRKQFLQPLPDQDTPVQVADLMTGMGETWPHIFKKWKQVQLTALDFSQGMLQCAARRNESAFGNQVHLLQEDALNSSLPAEQFDVVTCAFGLKTLDLAQMRALAKEIHRILKPNGTFTCVEVSEPSSSFLQAAYLPYIRYLIPALGYLFAREYTAYKMLGYYTKAFGNSKEAAEIFRAAGFSVTYQSFFKGCATGFIALSRKTDEKDLPAKA
ncbi:class I SAM-dependent methyltransferase [Rufibacter sediminis]|uniref:Class I SAM-dependent methyltransferase n=1 Tax=Rufibacter sediminis TaxID=2762756 RepID=A0ABR6VUR0_9BACT|nr:class I SAM-dependent methyltransferase [Rufibacter sediminis]MBC3540899.1 class I SAM-dependent methyltransferase [Rufibacter sediminis]